MSDDHECRCIPCHFEWEETTLFPALRRCGLALEADQLEADHPALLATVRAGAPDHARIEAHARREEEIIARACLDHGLDPALFSELDHDHEAIRNRGPNG
jgi:hypothetical protein